MKVRMVSWLATAALVVSAAATPDVALAQAPAKPGAGKPAGKPDPKKAAEEAKKAEEAKRAEEEKAAAEAKKAEEEKAAAEAKKAEEEKAAEDAKKTTEPPAETWDVKDVLEKPGKTYLFVGMRYRGTVVPKAFINIFVEGGATVYSNQFGLELDIRKDGFSLIPAISIAEYGTGNLLFKEKNSTDIPGNYNMVNSGIGAVYLSIDLLWSAKISKMFDFEYGLGAGLGFIFGDLVTNWVRPTDPNRPVSESNYTPCAAVDVPGTGCNARDHQNSDVNRVGGYTEPSWFNGGSKPSLFPFISFPQLGLRFKPVKMFESRLGVGFGLTGFWFGLSGNYGFERKPVE